MLHQNLKQINMNDFFVAANFPKTPSPNPARIPPQTPPAGGKSVEAKRKILSPRKKDFRFAESVLKPHALPSKYSGSAWGFLRAYALVSLHHARGACDIICFGNRCEFGTIDTPEQNSKVFLKQKCGTREARPKDSRRIPPTNSEFLAHWRALFFRQETGAKTKADFAL